MSTTWSWRSRSCACSIIDNHPAKAAWAAEQDLFLEETEMAVVTFFEKPGCAGNARQKEVLRAAGHELRVRDLLTHAWTEEDLLAFLAELPVADWFNRSAPRIKSGEIIPERLDRRAALSLLLAEPLLIRRPLLQVGEVRAVGFDPEKLDAWIGLRGPDGRRLDAADGVAACALASETGGGRCEPVVPIRESGGKNPG
jgi:nitrogenase-associated protein